MGSGVTHRPAPPTPALQDRAVWTKSIVGMPSQAADSYRELADIPGSWGAVSPGQSPQQRAGAGPDGFPQGGGEDRGLERGKGTGGEFFLVPASCQVRYKWVAGKGPSRAPGS